MRRGSGEHDDAAGHHRRRTLTVCGIAGLLDPDRRAGVDRLGHDAAAMAATLDHRGPDDRGQWVDPEGLVAFGHRRLSVVDLSPHGHQPMCSAD
ncbi:MAG: hypothetical protein ACLQPH_03240, partial [Acidimicrobiales bacterium]